MCIPLPQYYCSVSLPFIPAGINKNYKLQLEARPFSRAPSPQHHFLLLIAFTWWQGQESTTCTATLREEDLQGLPWPDCTARENGRV